MRDPFPFEPIPWLSQAVQPIADKFHMPTLPLHIHEVVGSAVLYSVIYYPISPLLSRFFFGKYYNKLSPGRRLNWDAHVVSMVQSILINAVALWVLWVDTERKNNDWEHRIWAYTGADAMVQAMAAGYFVWDLIVTASNIRIFGLGTLAHAVAALSVYCLGFRPFVNHYACTFILWELSTPFLNIHWFLDKIDMTGSNLQKYNGVLLIFTFFSCRLVFGTYQSYLIMSDIWASLGVIPPSAYKVWDKVPEIHQFTNENSAIPVWLGAAYLVSNLTLNGLNAFWFVKMIQAVTKRFPAAGDAKVAGKVSEKSAITAEGKATGVETGTSDAAKRRKVDPIVESEVLDQSGL